MEQGTLNRIKEYIDFRGITVSTLEKTVGMSNGSFASQLKKNKTIGVDKLEKILKTYPELSAEWLLTGKGSMLRNNDHANIKNEGNGHVINSSSKVRISDSDNSNLIAIQNEFTKIIRINQEQQNKLIDQLTESQKQISKLLDQQEKLISKL